MDKCSIYDDGKFVTPCETLSDSSEYGNPRGKQKGVFKWRIFNISTIPSTPSKTFFGVKRGEFIKNGIVFKFFPFYGENIDIYSQDTKQ